MNDPLLPLGARILEREELTENIVLFRFRLEDDRGEGPGGGNHRPGQFVMLSVFGVGEGPYSICHAPWDRPLELCIQRVGTVTRRLFELAPGDTVGLRGPYGRGYPLEHMEGHDLLLIAGGLGMAPLRSLLHHALRHRERLGRLTLAYGMREESGILFRPELEALKERSDLEVYFAVDRRNPGDILDAVQGHAGTILEPLELDPGGTMVACCGPPVMYGPVEALMRRKGVYPQHIFFTLERRMECGVGQCGHCAIGYRYTCLDGPVFSVWEARGLREAWESEYVPDA